MHLAGTHDDGFTASRARFEELITFLDGGQARVLDHGDLEKHLDTQGRELMRLLYQDHLELRAARERRLAHVIDAAGVDRPAAEAGHARALGTIFGQVQVARLAYRRRGHGNLHPADAELNLPIEKHSHGLRRPLPIEAAGRLSKGEKRHRKRIADVGAVHDATPVVRTIADILPATDNQRDSATHGPRATGKWLTASITQDAASVIAAVFDEARRRDPHKTRTWVALVDGANHQIDQIHAEATAREVTVHILIDIIHVIEYLWKAAWCFHTEGDPAAQTWVHAKARDILAGKASTVAATIRRTATTRKLSAAARKGADQAARYLTNKAPYLQYPTALAAGWPIATGVIEGACRHLVADRLDITGARWALPGAEAVLQLRALHNGDFDDYWRFHQQQEHQRVHATRYANSAIPQAA